MNNIEKLEYKLQLTIKYKEKFYTDNLKFRAAAKTSKTIAKIVAKKAILWAEIQSSKDIEEKGYPEINPFLVDYEQTFTLFYTPGFGLSEMPMVEDAVEAQNANEFYNAVKKQDALPWVCSSIDEEMFDLLNDKYGIDHTGGVQDLLRAAYEKIQK
ncbi:MAG: hypothetical protein K9L22_03805 [Methylococcaceae bacterium]|nr:hypothetical protein [Methylococcaceae bacterium]